MSTIFLSQVSLIYKKYMCFDYIRWIYIVHTPVLQPEIEYREHLLSATSLVIFILTLIDRFDDILTENIYENISINPLWLDNPMWCHCCLSGLDDVRACYHTAPSNHPNQSSLLVEEHNSSTCILPYCSGYKSQNLFGIYMFIYDAVWRYLKTAAGLWLDTNMLGDFV